MDQFAHYGVHLLEFCFFLGALGAIAVVLLSFVGDLRDLVSSDEPDRA